MSTVFSQQRRDSYGDEQYMVVSPEGVEMEIPRELFGALSDFKGTRSAGSVIIQFRNGGMAGLEALIKKTYK